MSRPRLQNAALVKAVKGVVPDKGCDFGGMFSNLQYMMSTGVSDTLFLTGKLNNHGDLKDHPVLIKVSQLPINLKVNNSPLIEIEIYNTVINKLIGKHITPNIVPLITTFTCNNFKTILEGLGNASASYKWESLNKTNNQKEYENDVAMVLVLDLGAGETLKSKTDATVEQLESIMFQVFYTLNCFNNLKQPLRHNDLHQGNILIDKTDDDAFITYVLSETDVYKVPTHGLMAKIIDYDRSYHGYTNTFLGYDEDEERSLCERIGTCNEDSAVFDTFTVAAGMLIRLSSAENEVLKELEALSKKTASEEREQKRNIKWAEKSMPDRVKEYEDEAVETNKKLAKTRASLLQKLEKRRAITAAIKPGLIKAIVADGEDESTHFINVDSNRFEKPHLMCETEKINKRNCIGEATASQKRLVKTPDNLIRSMSNFDKFRVDPTTINFRDNDIYFASKELRLRMRKSSQASASPASSSSASLSPLSKRFLRRLAPKIPIKETELTKELEIKRDQSTMERDVAITNSLYQIINYKIPPEKVTLEENVRIYDMSFMLMNKIWPILDSKINEKKDEYAGKTILNNVLITDVRVLEPFVDAIIRLVSKKIGSGRQTEYDKIVGENILRDPVTKLPIIISTFDLIFNFSNIVPANELKIITTKHIDKVEKDLRTMLRKHEYFNYSMMDRAKCIIARAFNNKHEYDELNDMFNADQKKAVDDVFSKARGYSRLNKHTDVYFKNL